MRSWMQWIAGGFILALLVHILTIYALPSVLMDRAIQNMLVNGPANTVVNHERIGADQRAGQLPNPDLLFSSCVYDVSQGPVKISAPVPVSFWLLSVYGGDGTPVVQLNESQVPGEVASLILVGPDVERNLSREPLKVPVITSPTERGIVVFRTMVNRESNFKYLEAARRRSKCVAVDHPLDEFDTKQNNS